MAKTQFADGLRRLKEASGHAEPPPPAMATVPRPVAQKRAGLVQIAAHFDPAVRRQLAMIGVEQNRDSRDLLAEALNDLFVKYNHSPLSEVYGEGSRGKPRAR
mgnify:FL=1